MLLTYLMVPRFQRMVNNVTLLSLLSCSRGFNGSVVVLVSEHCMSREKCMYLFIYFRSTLKFNYISLGPKANSSATFYQILFFWEILSFFNLWNSFLEAAPPLLKIHIEETTQESEGQQEQKLGLIPGPPSQNNLRQLKSTL